MDEDLSSTLKEYKNGDMNECEAITEIRRIVARQLGLKVIED